MGTLFSQPPRQFRETTFEETDALLSECAKLASKHKVPIETVLLAKQVQEMRRRNDLFVDDKDALDEQLAGFGELLEALAGEKDG